MRKRKLVFGAALFVLYALFMFQFTSCKKEDSLLPPPTSPSRADTTSLLKHKLWNSVNIIRGGDTISPSATSTMMFTSDSVRVTYSYMGMMLVDQNVKWTYNGSKSSELIMHGLDLGMVGPGLIVNPVEILRIDSNNLHLRYTDTCCWGDGIYN